MDYLSASGNFTKCIFAKLKSIEINYAQNDHH